jgi:hypothetical protein
VNTTIERSFHNFDTFSGTIGTVFNEKKCCLTSPSFLITIVMQRTHYFADFFWKKNVIENVPESSQSSYHFRLLYCQLSNLAFINSFINSEVHDYASV